MIKILHTVKYYEPSKGGMESVVKNIVEGVSSSSDSSFTIYSNNHIGSSKKTGWDLPQIKIIKEATPFIFKSQPLNFKYQGLKQLIELNDVIHHHYPFPNMEIALLRYKELLKKKKLIITWHANIKNSRWSFIKRYYNPIIKQLLDLAEYIVVTSPQLYDSSDILFEYKSKVRVIPLSYDPAFDGEKYVLRELVTSRPQRVLFVGKLRSYKGLSYLIEAIAPLSVDLTIVGDGEEEQNLKKQVSALNLMSRVKFLKNVTNSELLSIYQESDLFVLPSINEAEAFGVVQLEAMAIGLPVINTQLHSGVPFVSLNDVSGITVPPKDAIALRDAIMSILGNKERYQRFSENSYQRSLLFSRAKLSESYLNLYNT